MSSTPLPPDEPFLTSYLRVQRGKDRLQDLVEAFPTLERKALCSPPTLTEFEHRQLLDFPDAEEEMENIRTASSKSREELISLVLCDPGTLLDNEIELLKRRFWFIFITHEFQGMANGGINTSMQESVDRVFNAREVAYLLNEGRFFIAASQSQESSRHHKQRRDDKQRGRTRQGVEELW